MHTRMIYVALAIALLALTGCKAVVKPATHGTETAVIDKSPVSGKELDKPTKAQLELNPELLSECVVPLPKPPKGGSSRDISAIKKAETALYYRCAYMHNALVEFLDVRLGIRPAEKESKSGSK